VSPIDHAEARAAAAQRPTPESNIAYCYGCAAEYSLLGLEALTIYDVRNNRLAFHCPCGGFAMCRKADYEAALLAWTLRDRAPAIADGGDAHAAFHGMGSAKGGSNV
jgi:hypothetical protein